jgi:hypothetical protein
MPSVERRRGGFFTTLSYLNLLGQTYFLNSNDARRFSGLHFTLIGEGTARSGFYGAPAAPVPDCIDQTDSREAKVAAGAEAAVGSARILRADAICQTCHLSKGVAAGMILFRPFASNGRVYPLDQWGDPSVMPDQAELAAATAPDHWFYRPTPDADLLPVDSAFMKSMIEPANVRACIATKDPANPYQPLSSVNDLARYFLKNSAAVARGFARHANRSYRDLVDAAPVTTAIDHNAMPAQDPQLTTIELATKGVAALDSNTAKLPDLFEMYFASDSFACDD